MKPTTKIQKRVASLSEQLPDITEAQIQWAKQTCVKSLGFLSKSKIWCSDCGHRFDGPQGYSIPTRAVCPSCQKVLNVELSTRKKDSQSVYFSIIDTIDDMQVIRHFIIGKLSIISEPAYISINEAVRNFISPSGEYINVARAARISSMCYDNWKWDSPMVVRGTPYVEQKYNINALFIYPRMNVIPELKRNGFKRSFHDIAPRTLFSLLLSNSKAETMLKAGQFKLLYSYVNNPYAWEALWPQIKICIRNGYKIKDSTTWGDYLTMLATLNKDTRNPKFICPANLKSAHQEVSLKVRRIREIEQAKEKKERAIRNQAEFHELKSKFFGLTFSDDQIQVVVLDSVEQYIQEGDAMKHCVFTADYYNKEDSLILSARMGQERLETVEVSLSKLDVVQCRGRYNKNTPYHDRIINLVKTNINQIKQRV